MQTNNNKKQIKMQQNILLFFVFAKRKRVSTREMSAVNSEGIRKASSLKILKRNIFSFLE